MTSLSLHCASCQRFERSSWWQQTGTSGSQRRRIFAKSHRMSSLLLRIDSLMYSATRMQKHVHHVRGFRHAQGNVSINMNNSFTVSTHHIFESGQVHIAFGDAVPELILFPLNQVEVVAGIPHVVTTSRGVCGGVGGIAPQTPLRRAGGGTSSSGDALHSGGSCLHAFVGLRRRWWGLRRFKANHWLATGWRFAARLTAVIHFLHAFRRFACWYLSPKIRTVILNVGLAQKHVVLVSSSQLDYFYLGLHPLLKWIGCGSVVRAFYWLPRLNPPFNFWVRQKIDIKIQIWCYFPKITTTIEFW